MTSDQNKIKNRILCEDVRKEVGNKQSLIGVIGGDVLVDDFPATLQLAIYAEYVADPGESGELSIKFKLWQDNEEIAAGVISSVVKPDQSVSLILPCAMITFEKAATFRMTASIRDGAEFILIQKRIMT